MCIVTPNVVCDAALHAPPCDPPPFPLLSWSASVPPHLSVSAICGQPDTATPLLGPDTTRSRPCAVSTRCSSVRFHLHGVQTECNLSLSTPARRFVVEQTRRQADQGCPGLSTPRVLFCSPDVMIIATSVVVPSRLSRWEIASELGWPCSICPNGRSSSNQQSRRRHAQLT